MFTWTYRSDILTFSAILIEFCRGEPETKVESTVASSVSVLSYPLIIDE